MIKNINEPHTYGGLFKNLKAISSWVVEKLFNTIKNNPEIGIDVIATKLRIRFGSGTTKNGLYKARKKVLNILSTNFAKSYARLEDYANILLTKNRGSMVKICDT